MNTNEFPHYPRFIINCSDGNGLVTADLNELKHLTKTNEPGRIESFNIGDTFSIKWQTEKTVLLYKVSKIEIKEIMYDTDDRIMGVNNFDRNPVTGIDKYWLMGLYIFLDLVHQ
jgi:hypothetical protein